jgi:hypothetical protein
MPPVGFEPTISACERPQAAHLLISWVRIYPGAGIFVCCECRVLSGRGLCDELITRTGESYRLCCVVVCDLETSRMCAPYIYDISSLRVKVFWDILCALVNRYQHTGGKLPPPYVGVENEADSLQILVLHISVHYAISQYTQRSYMHLFHAKGKDKYTNIIVQIVKAHRRVWLSSVHS